MSRHGRGAFASTTLTALGALGLGACASQDAPEAALEAATQALGFCGEPLCFVAPDTLLNTTVAGAQDTPVVATAPGGNTLLVFRDRSGITADAVNGDALRGRVFASSGLPLGDDFVIETSTTKVQQTPAVAASSAGVFLVVWADNRAVAPDVTGYAVRARRFDADGQPLDAADFVVNRLTTGDQSQPVVAATPDGGFLVAWRDTSRTAPDTSVAAIRARRVDADGTLAANDILVNSTTPNDQTEPALAVAADGRWAVSFTDASLTAGDTTGTQVRLRLFGADDTPAGPDARLSARAEGDQRQSDLAFAPDGRLLVVFTDYQAAGAALGYEIRGRRVGADGAPLGEEFDVATTRGRNQNLPAVTALGAEGRWLVAFTDDSREAPDVSSTGIRGRLLGFDGAFDGPDQLLESATYGAQTTVALPARTEAAVLIAWADSGNVAPDVAAPAIRGRWLRFARCGDGRTDEAQGEACDDGNTVDGDGCTAACVVEGCGDGTVQAGEVCDDGAANGFGGPCLPDCTPAGCGDGIRQAGEGCDDANTTDGDGCTAECRPERCGDAVRQADEACDDGAANTLTGPCLPDCTLAGCGDGVRQGEETCDDGNTDDGDGCGADCTPEFCGDGRLLGDEACDDGAANALAGPCLPDCTLARCGDGIRQAGEACDDANGETDDGCAPGCVAEPPTPAECLPLCRPTATYDGCNGNDDDCDGQIDEDAAKGYDTTHCGGCDQGPCPAAIPYQRILTAPAGSTLWEPSGVAVVGDTLWVANDKDGVLAAYTLPLALGTNSPVRSMSVRPNGVTPKWEGLRWEPATGTFLLLNATGNTVWRCDPATNCATQTSVGVAPTVTALGAATRLESIAPTPVHLLLGTRASPSKTADEAGVATTLGNPSPDGRAYQMSDALYLNGRFYMTWSYEGAGTTLNDVAGFLAVTELDANGRPDPLRFRICKTLAGKPEGLDVWGDDFVVVFDEDDARKAKAVIDATRFTLRSTEDYAALVPRGLCD